MPEFESPAVRRLTAAHLLLAVAPAGMGFVSIELRHLPLLWTLASVPLAQVMLVAIASGMTPAQSLVRRIIILACTAIYLAIWSSLGQILMAREGFASAYMQNLCIFSILSALLTLALAGVSRWMGTIRIHTASDPPMDNPRLHFSLLALLAIFTAASVIFSLTRLSHMQPVKPSAGAKVLEYLLAVIVYALNTLATIWATLGSGHVKRRLVLVFGVAFLLGVSLAFSAGNSPEFEPWWFFSSLTLIVIVPTIIVALSLLYLRRHGFRLLPPASQSSLHPQRE